MYNTSSIDLYSSESKVESAPNLGNNISIGGINEGIDQSYAQRAKQLRDERTGTAPPDVISPTEKTEEGFHPLLAWEEVPSVHDDYADRKERLFSGGWNDEEQFLNLYHGKFSDTQYNKREGESLIARRFSFAFGKNVDIVAYEMENLPFQTQYAVDPWHRASVLEFAIEEVDSIYCEGIDLTTKQEIASLLRLFQQTTVPQLNQCLKVNEDQIRRTLHVLQTEDLIQKDQCDRRDVADTWINTGITEEYLDKLLSDKRRLEELK